MSTAEFEYPRTATWFIRASSTGHSAQDGTAVAIRLRKSGVHGSEKTYLLTCAHAIRRDVSHDQLGPAHDFIHAWQPNLGFGNHNFQAMTPVADILPIASFASHRFYDLSATNVPSADWAVLSFPDLSNLGTSMTGVVQEWAQLEVSTNDICSHCGFAGGAARFEEDTGIVEPTIPIEERAVTGVLNGIISVQGNGTRHGMSGGMVFTSGDMRFVGVHRSREDDNLQLQAVSAVHIRDRLSELGYEVVAPSEAPLGDAPDASAQVGLSSKTSASVKPDRQTLSVTQREITSLNELAEWSWDITGMGRYSDEEAAWQRSFLEDQCDELKQLAANSKSVGAWSDLLFAGIEPTAGERVCPGWAAAYALRALGLDSSQTRIARGLFSNLGVGEELLGEDELRNLLSEHFPFISNSGARTLCHFDLLIGHADRIGSSDSIRQLTVDPCFPAIFVPQDSWHAKINALQESLPDSISLAVDNIAFEVGAENRDISPDELSDVSRRLHKSNMLHESEINNFDQNRLRFVYWENPMRTAPPGMRYPPPRSLYDLFR